VFAPGKGDVAGIGSRAFLVDIAVQFDGNLASTGVSPELTARSTDECRPVPGHVWLGREPRSLPRPGGAAQLHNRWRQGWSERGESVQHQRRDQPECRGHRNLVDLDYRRAGAFGNVGELTPSHLFLAVVEGTAPDVVLDMDGNGIFNKKDLALMGHKVISNTRRWTLW